MCASIDRKEIKPNGGPAGELDRLRVEIDTGRHGMNETRICKLAKTF